MSRPSDVFTEAKARDDYTCQKCGCEREDSELECHFIVPLEFDGDETVDNVATLCSHCYRYAPDDHLEEDAYESVFEEYIGTNVRPEADFAYFGVLATEKLATAYCGAAGNTGDELGTDELLDSIQTVVDSIRELPENTETANPAYFWILFAQFAEYGCVPEAEPLTQMYIEEEIA
jgi:hypothetical protein